MKIGDTVTWESKSGGFCKTKCGTVVQVVPAGCNPIPGKLRVLGIGFGKSRKHESYLVQVGNVAYWPIAKYLKIEDNKTRVVVSNDCQHGSVKRSAIEMAIEVYEQLGFSSDEARSELTRLRRQLEVAREGLASIESRTGYAPIIRMARDTLKKIEED